MLYSPHLIHIILLLLINPGTYRKTRLSAKSPSTWDVQIVGMIFQTGSKAHLKKGHDPQSSHVLMYL
ncbi:DUF6783 domain-containing protein [Blautia faecis]|uniref:DUF6783 domain-containing protein n=1 Tax=Blautia faecis TaxID=871665 RepID=UPI003A7F3B8C